jgi:hypothetical protein
MKVGGYTPMKEQYGYAIPNTTLHSFSTCGVPPKDYFDLLRDMDADYPWIGTYTPSESFEIDSC